MFRPDILDSIHCIFTFFGQQFVFKTVICCLSLCFHRQTNGCTQSQIFLEILSNFGSSLFSNSLNLTVITHDGDNDDDDARPQKHLKLVDLARSFPHWKTLISFWSFLHFHKHFWSTAIKWIVWVWFFLFFYTIVKKQITLASSYSNRNWFVKQEMTQFLFIFKTFRSQSNGIY